MEVDGYPEFTRDSEGRLRTKDGWYKVIILLEEHIANEWTADDLVENHIGLGPQSARAVLAYYHADRTAIDAEVAERDRQWKEARREYGDTALQRRFEALLQQRMLANR